MTLESAFAIITYTSAISTIILLIGVWIEERKRKMSQTGKAMAKAVRLTTAYLRRARAERFLREEEERAKASKVQP